MGKCKHKLIVLMIFIIKCVQGANIKSKQDALEVMKLLKGIYKYFIE